MMNKRSFYYALLLLAGISSAACGSKEATNDHAIEPVTVMTKLVGLQPISDYAAYAGTVQPLESVRLATKVTGWIAEIPFEEGESVRRGQILVKLRNRDLEAQRSRAQATLQEASVDFENAETNLARIQALYAGEAATRKELDDMKSAYASARARKVAAESGLLTIDETIKYSEIRALFDGVVSRKFLDVGDLVSPGQPILEFENSARIKVVALVPEQDIQKFSIGDTLRLQIESANIGSNGREVPAIVHRIAPAADPNSRKFEIQVLADNPGQVIKSGMFARVVAGEMGNMALLIPKEAVFRYGQLQGVYVVTADDRAVLRWIQTGALHKDSFEVLAGLRAGERVVITTASRLSDGQKVEVGE